MANAIFTYIIITIVLVVFLTAAGITTTASFLLQKLNIINPSNLNNFNGSEAFVLVSGLFIGLATAGSLLVGYFTKSSPESILVAPLAGVLLYMFNDWIAVSKTMWTLVEGGNFEFLIWVVHIPFAALAGGFLIAIVNWWRGSD